jgi:hypothetical protein
MIKYFIHLFIAVDQLITAILGGWPDETLSSYAYRLQQQNKLGGRIFVPIINKIFFFQSDHCKNAYRDERLRYQFPPVLR